VRVRDSGGTANGGVDLSAPQTFTLTVTGVNDAPTFLATDPPGVHNTSGPQSVPGWATFIPGPPNEAGQSVLAYLVSDVSNPAMFSVLPAVDATGRLTYSLANSSPGVSTFTVRVQDNGGTANGGVDLSAPQTFTLIVNQTTTTTAVTSQTNPSVAGQPVTFQATVVANAAGVGQPEGLVRFLVNNVVAATGTLVNGVATATVPGTFFPLKGTYSIVARYEGAGQFNSSQSTTEPTRPPLQQTVLYATSVGITQSIATSVFAQAVTLTATVRGGQATGPRTLIPPGTVTFIIDGVERFTVALNASGVATQTLGFGTGPHTIQARYNGAVEFGPGTSGTLAHNTTRANSRTVLTSNRNPAYVGQQTVVTATVSAVAPGGGVPTGTVTFFVNGVAQGTAPVVAGKASFNVGALPIGRHAIAAQYSGSDNHVNSAVAFFQTVVNPTRLTARLVGSPLPPSTAFTLQVFAAGADGSLASGYNKPVSFVVLSAPPGGAITGVRNTTFVNGVANFTGLRLTRTGVYVIRVITNPTPGTVLFVDLTIDTQGRLT
jgi:hypothetical protein